MKVGPFKIHLRPKPQVTRGLTGEVFTVRYMIVQSKWFDILVRNIVRPNPRTSPMHCHGVEMFTVCLRGGYDDDWADGRERRVRFGSLTHLRKTDYHTAHTIYGKKGCWTLGLDARWKGLNSAGYLIDGKFVSMWRYAEMQGVPDEVVQSIRELTMGESARREAAPS